MCHATALGPNHIVMSGDYMRPTHEPWRHCNGSGMRRPVMRSVGGGADAGCLPQSFEQHAEDKLARILK